MNLNRFRDALDERIGQKKLIEMALYEPIPGGASWAYVFGSATLILFLVQLVTGIVLAMYYSPSATDAWASVAYLEREVSMGALVRGIHHHSAGAMVVMCVVHLVQVFVFGAYKKPREGNWLSGLALLGCVLAFALTGYLLPWDQTGYWATKVATNIAGSVPVVGPPIQRLLQGGNDYGNLTLTRFYTLHAIVLPLVTFGLVGVHLALFRKHGVVPSPRKDKKEIKSRMEAFWPRQLAYDTIFAFGLIVCMVALAVKLGAPLQAPSEPASHFIARPEWYFLFLFQLLKYFEGALQLVGTVIIPGLVVGFLVLLPFVDSGPSRRLRHRLPWALSFFLGLCAVGVLTVLAVLSDAEDPKIRAQKAEASRMARRARTLAAAGVPARGASYMMATDPVTRGERVFYRECNSCHSLGDRVSEDPRGPELTGYGSKAWIRQVLRDAGSDRLFGRTKVEGMEAFKHIPEEHMAHLVELVFAQRSSKAPPIEKREGAELLDHYECSNCHDFEEEYGLDGPTLYRYQSLPWIRSVIEDPGRDHFYGDANQMPAFGARLDSQDLDAVVAFLLTLPTLADRSRWPYVDDTGARDKRP